MDIVIWDKSRKISKLDFKIVESQEKYVHEHFRQSWKCRNGFLDNFKCLFAKINIKVYVNQNFELSFGMTCDQLKSSDKDHYFQYLPKFKWNFEKDVMNKKYTNPIFSKRNDRQFRNTEKIIRDLKNEEPDAFYLKRLKKIKKSFKSDEILKKNLSEINKMKMKFHLNCPQNYFLNNELIVKKEQNLIFIGKNLKASINEKQTNFIDGKILHLN